MLAWNVQHVDACALSRIEATPLILLSFGRPFAPALSLLAASSDSGLSFLVFGFDHLARRRRWSRVVARHVFRRCLPPFLFPSRALDAEFRHVFAKLQCARLRPVPSSVTDRAPCPGHQGAKARGVTCAVLVQVERVTSLWKRAFGDARALSRIRVTVGRPSQPGPGLASGSGSLLTRRRPSHPSSMMALSRVA